MTDQIYTCLDIGSVTNQASLSVTRLIASNATRVIALPKINTVAIPTYLVMTPPSAIPIGIEMFVQDIIAPFTRPNNSPGVFNWIKVNSDTFTKPPAIPITIIAIKVVPILRVNTMNVTATVIVVKANSNLVLKVVLTKLIRILPATTPG